jgi:hypothetical protein
MPYPHMPRQFTSGRRTALSIPCVAHRVGATRRVAPTCRVPRPTTTVQSTRWGTALPCPSCLHR